MWRASSWAAATPPTSALPAASFTGAAPDAQLVAVKVLGKDGSGSVSTVINGLDWCVQNKAALQHPGDQPLAGPSTRRRATRPTRSAPRVRAAVQAGLVVVCSAGNVVRTANGSDRLRRHRLPRATSPAPSPSGAMNTRAPSDRSDDTWTPTAAAARPTSTTRQAGPGGAGQQDRLRALAGLLPGQHLSREPGGAIHLRGNGDLLHALRHRAWRRPQVAGVAALMLQANPSLDPNTVKGILMYTAQKLQPDRTPRACRCRPGSRC